VGFEEGKACLASSFKQAQRDEYVEFLVLRLFFVLETHRAVTTLEPGEAVERLPFVGMSHKEIISGLVDEILGLISHLISGVDVRVCLVIDGEPLPAKSATHRKRSRNSYTSLKLARRLSFLYLGTAGHYASGDSFLRKFNNCSFAWVRWFGPLKRDIAEELLMRGFADGFNAEDNQKFSVVTAPYEADPVCVAIAHVAHNAAILSNDGDLITYPYADNAPVCSFCPFCYDALGKLTTLVSTAHNQD
jgi:hypothetical protein